MAEEVSILVEELPFNKAILDRLTDKLSGDQRASRASPSAKLQCPRVPKKLLPNVKAEAHDAPKRISLGPYHHGNPDLAGGEILKVKLAKAFVNVSKLTVDEICSSICNDVVKLKACYDETVEKFTDENFVEMMLVDGCALLWFLICVCLGHDHEDYDIRYLDLRLLHQDALLLENQLPYQLLQQLMKLLPLKSDCWTVIFKGFFGMIEKSLFEEFIQEILGIKEKPFLQKMKNCCCELFSVNRIVKGNPEHEPEEESKPCHHLLDLYRRNLLGDGAHSNPTPIEKISYGTLVGDVKEQLVALSRNVKELVAAGIRIRPSPTRHLSDISFTSHGFYKCLRLPPITIDKSTMTLFFNLIAYEMSSDVPQDFISYLRFLDSLIHHADDVKELQSAGVLQNNLGTHEEVAAFFNTVSANLDSSFRAYKDVRVKIRKHLKSPYTYSKLKMWMTQCQDNHLANPWTNIAWIAGALALFFTAVQAYFSAFHR